jgi:hypothetical protein
MDCKGSEGLKADTNVRGIRCHSHFLDIWCRHCKDSSWHKINERAVRKL